MNRNTLSFLVVILLFLQALPVDNTVGSEPDLHYDDWIIAEGETETIENETIIIEGNLTINGTLTLKHSNLIMNGSNCSIIVNGRLDTLNTSFRGNESYYRFRIYGELESHNSSYTDMAGSNQLPYQGGLEIHSDQTFLHGDTIRDNEFTGVYLLANATIRDTLIRDNVYNMVINGSSPLLRDTQLIQPHSVSLFLISAATPKIIGGHIQGEKRFDDELSYIHYCHILNLHVAHYNGTDFPDVNVWISSLSSLYIYNGVTDTGGWIREIIIPEKTVHKTIGDDVYNPYQVSINYAGVTSSKRLEIYSQTTLELILSGDHFGQALTRGDFNGDGLKDLAVGAPENRTDITVTGAVFVYFNDGGLELQDPVHRQADLLIKGKTGTGFGSTLASGDINGDGYDDLLVGSPDSAENGLGSGSVLFFMGSETPTWYEPEGNDFSLHGEPGNHYGRNLFVDDLNKDRYMDFVIGDDQFSRVFYGSADPAWDFAGKDLFASYPVDKGDLDDSGQSISRLSANDNDRYKLESPDPDPLTLHVQNFTVDDMLGRIRSVTMIVQYTTSQWYGYYEAKRTYMKCRIGENGDWISTIRPIYNSQNWQSETTETFDLFAHGIDSISDLKDLEIYFQNKDDNFGGQTISFDYIHLDILADPRPANLTLHRGNLSSGDINGDGNRDLLVSDPSGQMVYFGEPEGLGSPNMLFIEDFTGTHQQTYQKDQYLSTTRIDGAQNGDFDLEWLKWTRTTNIRNANNGQWEITTEEHGDWKVYDGPTASLGPKGRDTVASSSDESPQPRDGKLVSDPFQVPEGMVTFDFWHHAKWWDFERAHESNWQTDDIPDFISLRLVNDTSDEVIAERMYNQTNYERDGEYEGRIQFDISGQEGHWLRFEMELVTNYQYNEDGLVQVDDIHLLPQSYHKNGNFTSDWIEFNRNVTSYTPAWDVELNNGSMTILYRTNTSEAWNQDRQWNNDVQIELAEPSDRLQFKVILECNGSFSPRVSNLSICYLFQGQVAPLNIDEEYFKLHAGDMDGDGLDDLLFLDPDGIDIYYGTVDIAADFNNTDIQSFYDGKIEDLSVIDLQDDGLDELIIIGEKIMILDSDGVGLWQKNISASVIRTDIAADPGYHYQSGNAFFVPSKDHDLRLTGIAIPALLYPGSTVDINVTTGNTGMLDESGAIIYLNITADGYNNTYFMQVNISSMEMERFTFVWDLPVEEGVTYTLKAAIRIPDDREPLNDESVATIRSREHGIRISAQELNSTAHGGDAHTFTLSMKNTGTFESENITLDSALSADWDGQYFYQGIPVDHILVRDTEQVIFKTTSPFREIAGDFTVNLTGTADSASSGINLTATIIRPDLFIDVIHLHRADGTRTNDTIHGVAGEEEEIRIRVINKGPSYSTAFNVTLLLTDDIIDTFYVPHLDPGEDIWLSHKIILETGSWNVTARVDPTDQVPETDEDNNTLQRTFHIKDTTPAGPFNLTGVVRDMFDHLVENAQVRLQWADNDIIHFTDENGSFSHEIDQGSYHDTMIMYVNITDGKNITETWFILYSEDTGKHLQMVLNHYFVDMTGPNDVSQISVGENDQFNLTIQNTGNTNASFIIETIHLPEEWEVDLQDLQGNRFDLDAGETRNITVMVQVTTDPLYVVGNQRYDLHFHVYAERSPEANSSYVHNYKVILSRSLRFNFVGENTTQAQPGEMISFEMKVENLGNSPETVVPELIDYEAEDHEFNVTYIMLDIQGTGYFTINITMPRIRAGETLAFSIGIPDTHSLNAMGAIESLPYHSMECYLPSGITAKPGDEITIKPELENTGNILENVTLATWSPTPGLVAVSDEPWKHIDMDQVSRMDIDVFVPEGLMAGQMIQLSLNFSTMSGLVLNRSMEIIISPSHDIQLELAETFLIPGVNGTLYLFRIKAWNTGNEATTFGFKSVGDNPEYTQVPDTIHLEAGEIRFIDSYINVPMDTIWSVDNYLVPMEGNREFDEINLRIPSYSSDLITSTEMSQRGSTYIYSITVMNNGSRFESIAIDSILPGIGWTVRSTKDRLEISPGSHETFDLQVTTPLSKEDYGGNLGVTFICRSSSTDTLLLPKPPVAELDFNHIGQITNEDLLTFTGSQSVWKIVSYSWDYSDGTNGTGVTVSHSFSRAGSYIVTLTVADENGFTDSSSLDIVVVNRAPEAVILVAPFDRQGTVGDPFTLDGTFSTDRDGEIVRYFWIVSEFDEREGPVIECIFTQEGDYNVTLQVTDNSGAISTVTVELFVVQEPDNGDEDQQSGVVVERTNTDPLSFIPLGITAVILFIGVVFLASKWRFMRAVRLMIREKEKRND